MPALVAGIHVLKSRSKDVDGRNKSGHGSLAANVRIRPRMFKKRRKIKGFSSVYFGRNRPFTFVRGRLIVWYEVWY